MQQPTKLEVRDSKIKGRGVFATWEIFKGETLEECHFVEMTEKDYTKLGILKHYVFTFPIYSKTNCVVFGMASCYNHSSVSPSAYWDTDEENKLFRFIALRNIEIGEEILIDYKMVLNFDYINNKKLVP